jgi:hypothetical protein
MTKLTLNAAATAQLDALHEPTEICDPKGKTLGVFHPATNGNGAKPHSQYSREELEELRKDRSGCTLEEIWQRLETMGIPIQRS